MGIRFVTPGTQTLPLSDGEFIVIKKRLTHGERDDMLARLMPFLTPGEKMQVSSRDVRTVKVATYLTAWSSTEPIGPELSEEDRFTTIRNLDPDSFDEIEQALDAYLTTALAAKNGRAAARASELISASGAR